MTTTHTPAPWKVSAACMIRENHAHEWIHEAIIETAYDEASHPVIATVMCSEYRRTEHAAFKADPVCAANARLIAAAPLMLEALQLCRDCLTMPWVAPYLTVAPHVADGTDLQVALHAAIAAIAKATEEATP